MSFGIVEGAEEAAQRTEAVASVRNKVAAWMNNEHILNIAEPKDEQPDQAGL
jgi:hypothetical protein